jgi:hypothetical protein
VISNDYGEFDASAVSLEKIQLVSKNVPITLDTTMEGANIAHSGLMI